MASSKFLFSSLATLAIASSSFSATDASESADLDLPLEPKEWTFAVFINGNNNLDPEGAMNIQEMSKVGSNAWLNVVVQYASASANYTSTRQFIQKNNPQVLESLGVVDMGDYRSLVDFFNYTATNFPAKHYMLDIWDHGSGVFQDSNTPKPILKDISFDDNSGHSISTVQLGIAMRQIRGLLGGQPLDIYANDACLMQMIEVASQFQNPVTHDSDVLFQFGSEQTIPGQGWPYDAFLGNWTTTYAKDATPAQISSILTKTYIDSYVSGEYAPQQQVTYSGMDLSYVPLVLESVKEFGQAILSLAASDRKSVYNLFTQAQGFSTPSYLDILDFLSLASGIDVSDKAYQSAIAKFESSIKKLVVSNDASPDWNGRAHGVSMWFPQSRAEFSQYKFNYTSQLTFGLSTGFGDVLDALIPTSLEAAIQHESEIVAVA